VNDETKPLTPQAAGGPSKPAKLLAVAAFFFVLFLAAGWIGLPIPVGIAVGFFFAVAVPAALLVTLTGVLLLHFLGRISGRPPSRPLFDVGLQVFLITALLATGLFVVRFPAWLHESYPVLKAEIEGALSEEHTEAEKEEFLEAIDRFWLWNVDALLGRSEAPGIDEQRQSRDILREIHGALTNPDCPECPPELSTEESQRITLLIDELIPADETQPDDARLTPAPSEP
jgi:hypothetical protein